MLQTADLDFEYPENLIATKPCERGKSRILRIDRDRPALQGVSEITWQNFFGAFKAGDVLVLNDTEVLWARLIIEKPSGKSGEIFFLKTLSHPWHWEILSRALNLKVDGILDLPGGLKARVLKTGRISEIEIENVAISPEPASVLKKYFENFGHVPLPPYIMQMREKSVAETSELTQADSPDDKLRYQTEWAKVWGSVAAPTASLHFSKNHLEQLKKQGVKIATVTLHVGAGTFMPIETEKLSDFEIHSEVVNVSQETCALILGAKASGKKVWACGTTVLRALETAVWASGTAERPVALIKPFYGETKLFITPGYRFRAVDGLLTNFHQPRSSLLALAAAFCEQDVPRDALAEKAAVKKILAAYKFAIDKKFRLFSYGDLTVMY